MTEQLLFQNSALEPLRTLEHDSKRIPKEAQKAWLG